MASINKNSPAASAQVGIIPEFCGETDDWTVYREILEEFFKANGVLAGNKVSVLISVIGADTYRVLRDLCHPDSPKDKTYEELCALLGKQFVPEIAIFRERAKFYRSEQGRREDVKSWYARLKKLSVDCKFGEHLEPLLLDKFIVGLIPGPIQDRLCEENEKLTLKEAVDLAANRESAMHDDAIAEDLGEMNLEDRRHGRRKHGHRHHHGHHRGPHGFGHMFPTGYGHHFGPLGHGPQHFGPPAHGPHGHHRRGPVGRHGPPGPPEFFRGFEGGMGRHGCPFKPRGREMKRWAKKWRKHGRRSSSSSSSSSSSESSSSSSSSDDEEENKKRKCRKGGHKKEGRGHGHGHGHGGHGGKFGHHKHGGPRGGHGRRCGGRKEAEEPIATENTEPEIIE